MPLIDLANPHRFMRFARVLIPAFAALAAGLIALGLFLGFRAPADALQGDAARIMYVHVPSAWLALGIYSLMAVAADPRIRLVGINYKDAPDNARSFSRATAIRFRRSASTRRGARRSNGASMACRKRFWSAARGGLSTNTWDRSRNNRCRGCRPKSRKRSQAERQLPLFSSIA